MCFLALAMVTTSEKSKHVHCSFAMLVMGAPECVFGFQLLFFLDAQLYVSETLVMLPRNTIVLVIPSLCAAMLLKPSPGVSLLDLDSRLLAKFVAFLQKKTCYHPMCVKLHYWP